MPILQYDLSVVGVDVVERALAGIEKRFVTHTRVMTREAQRATRAPGMRASAKAAGEDPARAAKIAAAADRREWEKSTAAAVRLAAHAERAKQRTALTLLKETQRAEIRGIKDRERAEIAAAKKARHEWEARTSSRVGHVMGGTVSVARAALAATGLAGGGLIASRFAPAMDLERRQKQVIINARGAGKGNPIEYTDLRKRVNETAIATGMDQGGLTSALETYTARTGNLKAAVDNLDIFATAARATGSSVEDLASTAADLTQKFNIEKPEEMADALAALAFQGKKGAFELRDMASTFPELASAAQRAGMKGVSGMKTLGGLAQISRSATGSGAEASTALQMALGKLIQEGASLESGKALGGKKVSVFNGEKVGLKHEGSLRDVKEILADVISQSGGNLAQLQDVFDARGIRAVSPLISTFSNTAAATKGTAAEKTAAGRKAVLDAITDAANAAGNYADLQRDAADATKNSSVALDKLTAELTASVQRELVPVLTDLSPKLKDAIPPLVEVVKRLGEFAAFLAKNPLEGIGAIVLGKITADLAAARIGSAVRETLTRMLGGNAPPVPTPEGMPPGLPSGSKPSSWLSKVASAGKYIPIAGYLGAMAGEYLGNKASESIDKYGGAYRGALDTETAIMGGGMNQQQLMEKRDELRAQAQSLVDNGPSMVDKIAYAMPGSKQTAQQAHDKALNELKVAIGQLNATIENNTAAKESSLNRGNTPSPVKPTG